MKVRNLASNQTEVELNDGRTILVSYSTPVACHVPGEGFYRSEVRHSPTTSRHVNAWLSGSTATEKPQSFFDELL